MIEPPHLSLYADETLSEDDMEDILDLDSEGFRISSYEPNLTIFGKIGGTSGIDIAEEEEELFYFYSWFGIVEWLNLLERG